MQLNIFQYACLQNYKPFGARAITVRELCISVISFYSAAISPTPQRLYIQITKVIDKKFHEINTKYIYIYIMDLSGERASWHISKRAFHPFPTKVTFIYISIPPRCACC